MSTTYGALRWPKITPELLGLVRTGKVYSLQHVLEPGIPLWAGHPPLQIMAYLRHRETAEFLAYPATGATELVSMGMHTGTHIDALCHIGRQSADGAVLLHGGVRADDVSSYRGFSQLGVEHMPPIVTRLVLLDVPRYRGVELLPDNAEIGADELLACAQTQGVAFSPGCAVAVRTGWETLWCVDNERFSSRHPGIGLAAAQALVERGCVVIGADTPTVEVLPAPQHVVHQYLLVDAGVPLLENLCLRELAGEQCYESVLVVTPLKIRGATASVVHPIALA
ncbi:MAG TPA: cyclase family protein [Chloroflexota bacterium]